MHNLAEFRRSLSQLFVLVLVCNFSGIARPACADDPESTKTETLLSNEQAGHSSHGEVFDEGPRQAAYLMPGMSNVHFPVTCSDDLVQRFFNQGVAQLHGFWYYEAERSFRQAAVLDPDCAMTYWGMAMANVSNLDRARKFMAEAVKRRDSASEREKRFIDGFEKFITDTDKDGKKIEKKARAQQYTRDLETIVQDHPEDLEAKAFLALQLWENERSDLPIVSFVAINSLLQEVFNGNPMHPAHHYRIHLWDRQRAEMALESAAKAGPSLPGIAHMWHMPGHIYSKLNRYQDAVWQQEASARVDHAHMMRDRVMPDQIHNFAHNNEWLIRNLVKIGRVQDAIDLAKNMQELPRHPKYNSLKGGSSRYGRERLLLVLTNYRLWPELLELAETIYFEPTALPELQVERLRHMGIALALTAQTERATSIKAELTERLTTAKAELESLNATKKEEAKPEPQKPDAAKEPEAGKESETPPAKPKEEMTAADKKKSEANRKRRQAETDKKKNELNDLSKKIEQAIAAIEASTAATAKDWPTALKRFDEAGSWDTLLKAEWLAESNEVDKAIELVDKEIKANPNEVLPWSTKVWIYSNAGNNEGAKSAFAELRNLACTADLTTPMLARHHTFAAEHGYPEHWATEYAPAKDIGERPDPDSLGSFRWHPYIAPQLDVQKADGQPFALSQLKGKPTVVFFYLGFGCLHCIEQLHAFSPVAGKFREAGVEMVAISSESLESLKTGLDRYSKAIEIPLHADPKLTAFKSFRCFDDFELKPLHGTFLIDHNGRVLWQDIGSEPFKDVEFLTNEAGRLLKLAGFPNSLQSDAPK
ncbi:MAG: redoxin domain-containing protein [Pirellulaceae bacterium]|nr:redoxin domain-containing protein [Pirellulaceae bacterium]